MCLLLSEDRDLDNREIRLEQLETQVVGQGFATFAIFEPHHLVFFEDEGNGRRLLLAVLTRIVVDVGEASGVELELSGSSARSHGGFSCPTVMPG
jgi:hypothetical protein